MSHLWICLYDAILVLGSVPFPPLGGRIPRSQVLTSHVQMPCWDILSHLSQCLMWGWWRSGALEKSWNWPNKKQILIWWFVIQTILFFRIIFSVDQLEGCSCFVKRLQHFIFNYNLVLHTRNHPKFNNLPLKNGMGFEDKPFLLGVAKNFSRENSLLNFGKVGAWNIVGFPSFFPHYQSIEAAVGHGMSQEWKL